MTEIHEKTTYKVLGQTITVQSPELIDPRLNEIKMIVRKPRYYLKNTIKLLFINYYLYKECIKVEYSLI